jgi:hypothetical protein
MMYREVFLVVVFNSFSCLCFILRNDGMGLKKKIGGFLILSPSLKGGIKKGIRLLLHVALWSSI